MSDNNNEYWQNRQLGGLWRYKNQKTGDTFFAGSIEIDGRKVRLICFKNNHKQPGEKTPDYRIYESEEMNQQGGNNKRGGQGNYNRGGGNKNYNRSNSNRNYNSGRGRQQQQHAPDASMDKDVILDD